MSTGGLYICCRCEKCDKTINHKERVKAPGACQKCGGVLSYDPNWFVRFMVNTVPYSTTLLSTKNASREAAKNVVAFVEELAGEEKTAKEIRAAVKAHKKKIMVGSFKGEEALRLQRKAYTLGELAELYLDSPDVKGQTSRATKEVYLKSKIIPFWGRGSDVNGLGFPEFESFKRWCLHEVFIWNGCDDRADDAACNYKTKKREMARCPECGAGMSTMSMKPASFNRHLSCLNDMVRYGVKMKEVDKVVLEALSEVKIVAENNEREEVLSDEDIAKYFAAALQSESMDYRDAFLLSILTTFRRAELYQRSVEKDIKFFKVMVPDGAGGEREEERVSIFLAKKRSKGKKVTREATLGPIGVAIVRRRLERYGRMGYKAKYLFENIETGKAFKSLKTAHATTLRRAGIKSLPYRDLRHHGATILAMLHYNAKVIQMILGHTNIKTSQRYIKPRDISGAYSALEAAVGRLLPENAVLH